AILRSRQRTRCPPLLALSTPIPAVSNIPTLLLSWGCYHTRLVCAGRCTVTTHHESSIARPCWPSVASGCRAATASHRSTPGSGEFAATSDWKKIRTPGEFLKNQVAGCYARTASFVVLAVLFAQSALAQQFYRWMDQKGQWHYSDFQPSGVKAEKVEIGDTTQEPVSQPSFPSAGEQDEAKDNSDHSTQVGSGVDPLGTVSRRLLVLPPSDPSKPLSEWIPVESFDSVKECVKARHILLVPDMGDFRINRSRCISLAEFNPRKEANVIISATTLGS